MGNAKNARQAQSLPQAGVRTAKGKAEMRTAQRGSAGVRAAGARTVAAEERHKMIEFAAYQRAEKRGFAGGSPLQDWLEAEVEIDEMLSMTSH